MTEKKEVYLTKEGYEEVKSELEHLINVERPENINAIKEARALGDLSENADYDAARNDQAELEAKIKKLQAIVDNVTIIEEINTDKVSVGNTVKISYVDDPTDVDQYKIVGSQEADPFESKISNESPIAVALLGHKIGDTVSVESPNGSYEVKVIEIK
jgi:transcription elongation factor GreA